MAASYAKTQSLFAIFVPSNLPKSNIYGLNSAYYTVLKTKKGG